MLGGKAEDLDFEAAAALFSGALVAGAPTPIATGVVAESAPRGTDAVAMGNVVPVTAVVAADEAVTTGGSDGRNARPPTASTIQAPAATAILERFVPTNART